MNYNTFLDNYEIRNMKAINGMNINEIIKFIYLLKKFENGKKLKIEKVLEKEILKRRQKHEYKDIRKQKQ